MKYFALFDSTTNLLISLFMEGEGVGNPTIPTEAKEVTQEQHQTLCNGSRFWKWSDSHGSIIAILDDERLEELRAHKALEISQIYAAQSALAIDCTGTDGTSIFTMDAGKEHAAILKAGYDLAILNNETSMNIVDFYDTIHVGVDLNDVLEIVLQQGLSARADWEHKVQLKRQVLDAVDAAELGAISWE